MIEHVEFLVEEPSAEALLRSLLPRFLTDVSFDVHAHQGKPDLLAKLPARLNGYARFLPDTVRVVVLVDRDDDDCHALKERLIAKKVLSRIVRGGSFEIVNRIAIEELEAWYFGDWDAVREVYPRVNAALPRKSGYRDPDAIHGGTWEAFERALQTAGYMKGGLRKTEAAREIGKWLEPERNRSTSFHHFWRSITESREAGIP